MRLLFAYPKYERPAGGMKQARIMVSRLRAAGVDAMLLREDPAYEDDYLYDVAVPSAEFGFAVARDHVRPDDVVILPEHRLDRWLDRVRGWNCRLAINNQNGYFALDARVWGIQRRFGVEFVIANSTTVAEISRLFLGVDGGRVFLVPHLVVRPPFELPEKAAITGDLAVAYMPRKCADETQAIRDEVRRRVPDVPWVEIDRVPISVVAERMSACRVFLSTQDREGCPLPSLEAMTRGCLVAGYPGTPGFPHPYADSSNGFWSRDRSAEGAVEQVVQAIEVARENGDVARMYASAARKTLQSFTEERVDRALAEMIETVKSGNYDTRQNQVPRMPLRSRLTAYRHLKKIGRLFLRERLLSVFSPVEIA